MKKITLCLFALILSFTGISYAADVNNGINDSVVVSGTPAITGEAVDCQLRLIEFALETRLTISQKNTFLKAIKAEGITMDSEARADFLEAVSLVDSLNQLEVEDQEEIRAMLQEDFKKTSIETKGDPAADLYRYVLTDSNVSVIKIGEVNVTKQAVEAFAEYLAFLADTANPTWYNKRDIAIIETKVKTAYASLSDEERETLENFHYTWYLVRAAWQSASAAVRIAWQRQFKTVGIKPANVPSVNNIKAALNVKIYGDLLDKATIDGIEPIEWSPKTKIRVW